MGTRYWKEKKLLQNFLTKTSIYMCIVSSRILNNLTKIFLFFQVTVNPSELLRSIECKILRSLTRRLILWDQFFLVIHEAKHILLVENRYLFPNERHHSSRRTRHPPLPDHHCCIKTAAPHL